MPSRARSKKRSYEKKGKVKLSPPATIAEQAVSKEKAEMSQVAPTVPVANYAYVARDLRRIGAVTGAVLLILILLYIFLH